jgi:hypothetical protein
MRAILDDPVVAVAGSARRPLLPSERDSVGAQPVLAHHSVDEALGQGVLRGHGRAGGDHLQGCLGADDAWQPLGSAGARQEAEIDFGQAEPRRGGSDPIVAGERHLQAAAEGHAVNGRDDWLRGSLDHLENLRQPWRDRRLAEFGDVGARRELPARTNQDDRDGVDVGFGARQGVDQCAPQPPAEGVHRPVFEGQDSDAILDHIAHKWVHPGLPEAR